MHSSITISLLIVGTLNFYQVNAAPREDVMLNKVFNYQGSLPIKDDRTEEVIKTEVNSTELSVDSAADLAAAEAACWKLLNEQSGMYKMTGL